MRTVTFSDAGTAKYVNENFVPAWANRVPKFHNCELATEQVIATHKGEIFPTRNICSFILDPEGNCLHLMSGFYAPGWFRPELEFGLKVYRQTRGADGAAKFAALHEERQALREEQPVQVRRMKLDVPEGFQKQINDMIRLFPCTAKAGSPGKCESAPSSTGHEALPSILRQRRDHLANGLQHLFQVHRELASKAKQGGKLPDLADVLTAHNAADPFAEE